MPDTDTGPQGARIEKISCEKTRIGNSERLSLKVSQMDNYQKNLYTVKPSADITRIEAEIAELLTNG